jgi:hypothetical protein
MHPIWKSLELLAPHNVKHSITMWSTIPHIVMYPREMKIYIHIKTYTGMFIATLFIIVPKWKQPKCRTMINV